MKIIDCTRPIIFFILLLFPLTSAAGPSRVLRVIDGDTIQVLFKSRPRKLKFLKVDIPESVYPSKRQNIPLKKAAYEFTKRHLTGRYVSLEFEGEFTGRYGVLLAYVFVDGINFNLEIVSRGLSPYYTRYGASRKYDKEFKTVEKRARDAKLGIWNNPELTEKYLRLKSEWAGNRKDIKQLKSEKKVTVYHGNIKSKKFHKPSCRYFFSKDCKIIFHSRDEAVAAGYIPCRECKP